MIGGARNVVNRNFARAWTLEARNRRHPLFPATMLTAKHLLNNNASVSALEIPNPSARPSRGIAAGGWRARRASCDRRRRWDGGSPWDRSP